MNDGERACERQARPRALIVAPPGQPFLKILPGRRVAATQVLIDRRRHSSPGGDGTTSRRVAPAVGDRRATSSPRCPAGCWHATSVRAPPNHPWSTTHRRCRGPSTATDAAWAAQEPGSPTRNEGKAPDRTAEDHSAILPRARRPHLSGPTHPNPPPAQRAGCGGRTGCGVPGRPSTPAGKRGPPDPGVARRRGGIEMSRFRSWLVPTLSSLMLSVAALAVMAPSFGHNWG